MGRRIFVESVYSEEGYAWCHIEVQTNLHATLHNLASLAQEVLGQRARMDFKQAYHLSIRAWVSREGVAGEAGLTAPGDAGLTAPDTTDVTVATGIP